MPEVKVGLQRFDSLDDATRVADDIRNAGSVSYTDNSGSTVNVTVGDVTVEDGTSGGRQQSTDKDIPPEKGGVPRAEPAARGYDPRGQSPEGMQGRVPGQDN